MKNVTPGKESAPLALDLQVLKSVEPLDAEYKAKLKLVFETVAIQGQKWLIAARSVVVRDEFDTEGMAEARRLRLEIRDVRLKAGEEHEKLKKPLRTLPNIVDACERCIREACEPAEKTLLALEKFAETKAANDRAALAKKRAEKLSAISVDARLYATQCSEFTPDQWEDFYQGQLTIAQAKKDKAAQDKIDQDNRDQEARRLKQQNADLLQRAAAAESKVEEMSGDLERERLLSEHFAREAAVVVMQVTATPEQAQALANELATTTPVPIASDFVLAADYADPDDRDRAKTAAYFQALRAIVAPEMETEQCRKTLKWFTDALQNIQDMAGRMNQTR